MSLIYLDHAATTPVDPSVNAFMYETASRYIGNPSSPHTSGQRSRSLLESCRRVLAEALNTSPADVVFTSGGTESNNLGIRGIIEANTLQGKHIITSQVEHPSVLNIFKYYESLGYTVSYINVNEDGQPDLNQLEKSINNQTILVSFMLANNETGSLFPVYEIGRMLEKHQAVFHCDAVQAFGKMKLSLDELKIDLMSISAHKIYGPKGIGALVTRPAVSVKNIFFGGSQEANRRPGTENLTAIAGFAKAVELCASNNEENFKISNLRDKFERELGKQFPDIKINAGRSSRICGLSNIYFPFISGESMLINLDQYGIAISTGSACSSGSQKPSHVLEAMGFDAKRIEGSVRFSFGRTNNEKELDKVLQILWEIFKRVSCTDRQI